MRKLSMNDPTPLKPARLIKVPHEAEAGIIVSALMAQGIQANSTGEFTSGLRAETPGMVQVWVHENTLERAREILKEVELGSSDINWAEVDTGDSSPITEEELKQRDAGD